MTLERRDILFYFTEAQFALTRLRGTPAGDMIPRELDEAALIEAMHTKHDQHTFHDQRRRMLAGIDPDLAKQSGVVFRATRTGTGPLLRSGDFIFFVPDAILAESLALECRNRKIMLPMGAEKQVIVDTLTIGLRFTIHDGMEIAGDAG